MRRLGTLVALIAIAFTLLQVNGCGMGTGSTTKNPPPVQFVQTAATTVNPTGSGQSFTTTFGSPVTAGNTIVTVFWWMHPLNVANGGIASVTDDEGNTYQVALDATGVVNSSTQADILYFYAPNAKGGTPAAVTITTDTQAYTTEVSMVVLEYSGVSAVDEINTQQVLDGSIESTGMVTTHAAPEIVLGSLLITYTTTMGTGAGYNSRFQSSYFAVEDKVVSTTGSYDAEFNMPPPYPQYLIAIPSMVAFR